MAARQSILVDSLDRHLPAADLPARKGVCEPRAVGLLERDLDGSRQSDQCLSGDPWSWRLLGGYPREVSFHSVLPRSFSFPSSPLSSLPSCRACGSAWVSLRGGCCPMGASAFCDFLIF